MNSKISIIISGAGGQLGRSLRDIEMPESFTPHFYTRAQLDITDSHSVQALLRQTQCDVFVNCASYTQVDKAESEIQKATAANVDAVATIAQQCAIHKVSLIHISTDYVYDNGLLRPLKEQDPLNPQSVYAKTKLAGEQAAQHHNPATVIIRTSWVFSDYGHNFVKTMLRLASEGRDLQVVADQVGCPTYALDLARAIVTIIDRITQQNEGKYGIYNFSNQGETTWYDFAVEIFRQAGLSPTLKPVSSADYEIPAARPKYGVLDISKFIQTFKLRPRKWQEALQECLPHVIQS